MRTLLPTFVLLACCSIGVATYGQVTTYIDPNKTDSDFEIQGEYAGTIQADEALDIGLQIIALGDGKFEAVAFSGGLPGESDSIELPERVESQLQDDGTMTFFGSQAEATYRNGMVTIVADGVDLGTLTKKNRKSKTLGAKPPENATVLFDGKSADQWKNGKLDSDLLVQGTSSHATFGDHQLHIEFRLPYMPQARGQQRGNSGIYLQGRYEVQMLDSFGLQGKHNECGGIYSIKDPDINMCFPPLTWQTYDIDFTAAKYAADGTVAEHPRMTVRHNGVLIHDDVELPKSNHRFPIRARPRTRAGLPPRPQQSGSLSQHLGGAQMMKVTWRS